MTYLRVLDEGVQIQDYCISMDFVGAGVTVTRPWTNDSIVVTIPGAAAVTGWTDDGAIVRLTTIADNVSIGSVDIIANEKLRVVAAPGGVAIRVEGREWFPKTGAADAAGSQAPSFVERFTASMWNAAGNAEVERDFDIYAGPSTLADDETTARAQLEIFYEGFRLLAIRPDAAALGAADGVVFVNDKAAGTEAFGFLATVDYAVGDIVFAVDDGGGNLFQIRGTGLVNTPVGYMTAGTQVVGAQGVLIADAAGGITVDAEARTAINTLLARCRAHGLIAV